MAMAVPVCLPRYQYVSGCTSKSPEVPICLVVPVHHRWYPYIFSGTRISSVVPVCLRRYQYVSGGTCMYLVVPECLSVPVCIWWYQNVSGGTSMSSVVPVCLWWYQYVFVVPVNILHYKYAFHCINMFFCDIDTCLVVLVSFLWYSYVF